MPRPPAKPSKGKGKAKAAPRISSPHFLTIALELREIIYKHLLREAPSSLTDLLVVSRQLSAEVLPFQFKRHLTFDGQSELFDWLNNVDHKHLHNVVDISFKLHDIDSEKIVGALGKRLRQANISKPKSSHSRGSGDNPYYEACDAEMKTIGEAFKMIPNIQKLTIATTDAGDPQPPQRMLTLFSRILAHRFRHIHTLVSYEDALPVEFISNKSKLRRLRFPAISTSSNAEVAGIFSSLPTLELEIYRLPHQTPVVAPKRRILAQVLRSLPPLRGLLLYEPEAESESEEPDLLYETFVHCKDAFAKHRSSIRKFKFSVDPNAPVQDEDEEWVMDARVALQKYLSEAARQRTHIVNLDPDRWHDRDAP